MDRLDAETKRTLQLAAVVGSTFQRDELLAISGEPETLDAHLMILQRAMLIRPVRHGRPNSYMFHHALIWEAVYRSMLRRNLRRLHRQVGEALERLHSETLDDHAGLLAQHFSKAGDERAIAYAIAAGDRAQSLFAPEEAIVEFDRAFEILGNLKRSPPATLHRKRGRAYETRGSLEEARNDFEAALEIARTGSEHREEWETLVDIGRTWEGVDYDRAGEWFERAIELARQLEDQLALAHSLNRVGTWYTNTERVDLAREAHLEALSIFEDLEDEHGIAATVDYLGVVADISGDLVEMRARWERAIDMFERLGDIQHLSSTLASMAMLRGGFVFETVNIPQVTPQLEAIDGAQRSLELARKADWRSGEAYALMNLAGIYLTNGDYGYAFETIAKGIEIAREIGHREWLTACIALRGCIYDAILASDLAIETQKESAALARSTGSRHFIHLLSGFLSDALTETGKLDSAKDLLNEFAIDLPMHTVGQRQVWVSRANWLLASGDGSGALEILDRLLETGYHIQTQEDVPLVAWRRGLALIELNRVDEAEEALLAASSGLKRLNNPAKLWRIEVDLARLYYLLGRDTVGAGCLETAREIVEGIAPNIYRRCVAIELR